MSVHWSAPETFNSNATTLWPRSRVVLPGQYGMFLRALSRDPVSHVKSFRLGVKPDTGEVDRISASSKTPFRIRCEPQVVRMDEETFIICPEIYAYQHEVVKKIASSKGAIILIPFQPCGTRDPFPAMDYITFNHISDPRVILSCPVRSTDDVRFYHPNKVDSSIKPPAPKEQLLLDI